jgi:hypothetical protein
LYVWNYFYYYYSLKTSNGILIAAVESIKADVHTFQLKIHDFTVSRIATLDKVSVSIEACGNSLTGAWIFVDGFVALLTVAHFNCSLTALKDDFISFAVLPTCRRVCGFIVYNGVSIKKSGRIEYYRICFSAKRR